MITSGIRHPKNNIKTNAKYGLTFITVFIKDQYQNLASDIVLKFQKCEHTSKNSLTLKTEIQQKRMTAYCLDGTLL